MTTDARPILVGIDGAGASAGALRAAIADARRRGAPLRLVHVVPDGYPLLAFDSRMRAGLTTDGARLLAEAAAEVSAHASDLEVEAVLRRGGTAAELADEARQAEAVYLGRDPGNDPDHERRANAGAGVAARTRCPVVVVPAEWDPDTARGPVVVGVKSPPHSFELLADAFAAAYAQRERLIVLHAWGLPGMYDDMIASRVGPGRPEEAATQALEDIVQDWRIEYPRVEVEVRTVHARPVRALLSASRSSGMVVVLRRTHGLAAALGGTVRALLREAERPVRVVPPGTPVATPGLLLERSGRVSA